MLILDDLTYSIFVTDQEAVLAVVWERNMASQGEFSDR